MVDALPSASRPSTLQLNGEAVPHWASRLSLPAGILFEIEHKSTGRVVVSSQTFEAGNAPRVSVPEGALFAHEVYLLRVLASTSILPTECEFVCTGAPNQEATLLVRRAAGPVQVSFVSYEFGSAHWAASLALPASIYFEILHNESGALVHTGCAGEANRVDLPSEAAMLYIGEEYTLRALSSALLQGSSCCFTVRPVAVVVELALERAIGSIVVQLRAADDAPLPEGLPFHVWHRRLRTIVAEGRTSMRAPLVPCELWFTHQGALYVGEEYEVALLPGHGYRAVPAVVKIGDVPTAVQLLLHREEASAAVQLLTARPQPGRDTLEPLLPLPRDMILSVHAALHAPEALASSLSSSNRDRGTASLVGSVRAAADGAQQQLQVPLTPEVPMVAGRRYVLELEASAHVLKAAAVLNVEAGAARSVSELVVRRAWKPLLVVVLFGEAGVKLHRHMSLTVTHAATGFPVASARTEISDIEVRTVLQADEALLLGAGGGDLSETCPRHAHDMSL